MDPLTAGVGTAINTGLTAIAKVLNLVKEYGTSYYKDSSLSEVAKLTRVEPITVVSKDLLNSPEIRDVLNSLLSTFSGYYLQSIDILTKVNDVEVVRILDRLNPDRDETGFLLAESSVRKYGHESFNLIASEGYFYRLPTFSRPSLEKLVDPDEQDLNKQKLEYAKDKLQYDKDSLAAKKAEANYKDNEEQRKQNEHRLKMSEPREQGQDQDFGNIELDTLVNLSIGRQLNVKISYAKTFDDGRKENRFVTIPINVRLLVSSIPSDSIVRLMTYKNQDLSLIERIHSAGAGSIEFMKDLILCQDLIDEYKKASIQDPTNILSEITRRANNAKKFGLLTKNPSLVAASTLIVISDAVAREVENKFGGKIENPRIRDKIFNNTYSMIITVVSHEWETVTFYTRGIARSLTVGFKELHGKSKGNGPDIGDILKALTAGQPPSF